MRAFFKRITACMLLITVLVGILPQCRVSVYAATKTLTRSMAESLAYSNSSDYTKIKNKLTLAKVQYDQAVKSIKMKQENQRTFRWSPLLNFKFPESPTLADEYEYTYKPLELQSELDSIKHELNDCVYGVYEKVLLQFVTVYKLQETISYNESRLTSYKDTLSKNKIRLVAGLATQTDVDTMENKVSTLESTIASDKRSYESAKSKLSDIIGLDVSTGYKFASPFVTVELDRDDLEDLIDYTLENDDDFYNTRLETSNGLLALDTNYNLMKNKYGSSAMSYIDSYINQAKKGETIDSAAFKLAFNDMLTAVDQPWVGKKKILFIKIPKIWFKGATDGQRYVEDEPYVLYEAALEYQSLVVDEASAKKELTDKVTEYYETYVSTKNSYEKLVEQLVTEKNTLAAAKTKNLLGEMTYEEYQDVREEYEDMQMDMLEAQAAYSEAIFSLDRLTCGAVTQYMTGSSVRLSVASGGQSYVVEEDSEGVYYYIHSLVENNVFELGLSVPDDYEIELTDYELWVDGMQVGDRTDVEKTIRHLALDIDQTEKVFIRLYNDDEFVADCEIDPEEYSGLLTITTYSVTSDEDTQVGTYSGALNSALGVYELTFSMDPEELAAYYNVKTSDGSSLISTDKISIKSSFRYLSLTQGSLEDLIISFYDENEKLLYEATLDTTDETVHKITE